MSTDAETLPAPEAEARAPATPPLPRRLLDAVFSPGKMAREVSADPRWAGALLVCLVLVALSTALIPPELFAEVQRRAMIERGVTGPAPSAEMLDLIRIFSVVGSVLAVVVFTFAFAGIYTFIFAFVLGDEGRYKQYLAVSAHAGIIPSLMALLLAPLRVAAENPQLTLSVGSFLPFLEAGYLLSAFRLMDLSQIWAALVTAVGAHAIDRRRSFGSAAAILVGMTVAVALVMARFIPMAP